MQLKWLRFRFRGCRGMSRVWVALGACAWIGSRLLRTPVGSRPTAVASGPEGRSGGTSALVWRTYSRPSGGLEATEERREFSRVQRRPIGPGRLCALGHRGVDCVQCSLTASSLVRGVDHALRSGCWCSNGCIRPVLKHGPRSATCVRVLG